MGIAAAMAMTRPERTVTPWRLERGLFVLEDGGGVVGVLGGDDDDVEGLVDEGVGAVSHLNVLCEIGRRSPSVRL